MYTLFHTESSDNQRQNIFAKTSLGRGTHPAGCSSLSPNFNVAPRFSGGPTLKLGGGGGGAERGGEVNSFIYSYKPGLAKYFVFDCLNFQNLFLLSRPHLQRQDFEIGHGYKAFIVLNVYERKIEQFHASLSFS